jgi:hypothetical protein
MLRRFGNGLEFFMGGDNFPNGQTMARQVCFPSGQGITERNFADSLPRDMARA